MACKGGKSGKCNRYQGDWKQRKVICGKNESEARYQNAKQMLILLKKDKEPKYILRTSGTGTSYLQVVNNINEEPIINNTEARANDQRIFSLKVSKTNKDSGIQNVYVKVLFLTNLVKNTELDRP